MVANKPDVLIVDDDQAVCDLLYSELDESGYLCVTAANGNDALRKLAEQHFDIVLLDIKLPGVCGVEVLRRIHSAHHDTAAIMITAINDVDTAVEAMKLGAVDYVVKPFNLARVSASMCAALEAKKRMKLCCIGDEKEDKEAMEESFDEMNAIAYGVEVKQDLLTGHPKIVTQKTIDVAQQMGIPEREIQRWAAIRLRNDARRIAVTKSAVDKLKRSPLARQVMGITVSYPITTIADESQN